MSGSETVRAFLVRAAAYVIAAALLGTVVGFFYEGSVGGGIVLGVAVGIGVAGGILIYELFQRMA